MTEKSPGTHVGTDDLTTKVDYHRLLWQELNRNFGDASSIFVMAVGQQLSSSDYDIDDQYSLAAHYTFQLVDHIISCATNYTPTGSLISRMFERLLRQKGQTAGPDHQPAFEKAKNVLYADYDTRQITELYQDYLDKEIALKQNKIIMKQEFQIKYGDQWQSNFNKWLQHSKEYIEFQRAAEVVQPHLDAVEVWKHGPLVHKLNQMRQVLKDNVKSVIDYTGRSINYYHVSLQPANWYQWFDQFQHEEGKWMQINVDSKNDDDDQAALYEKLGGSITKYQSLNKQSDVKISFKVRAVQINRPWLDLSILENRNFTINGEDPGSWSTGELDAGNKGLFPLLTTQMIVARDITVNASTEMEEKAITDACSLFGVGGDSYKIINNNTIELKGTKLIGYVCTVVPKFPKQPIPNEILQNAHEIPRAHDEHKKDNENIKANHLWTQEDLVQMVSSATKEAIPIPKNIEEEVRNSVVIWLVTMNTNETLATQVYLQQLDDKHVYKVLKTQNSQDITYYVGKYGNYPAVLINVPTDFEIHDTTSDITKITFEYFPNIIVVINVGVLCGVENKVKMCNVLVSSEIVNYNKDGVRGEKITVSPQLTKLFTQSTQWPSDFIKKYLNDNQIPMPIVQSGVILSGPYLSEDHEMKVALVENVSPEAIGIEIEGMHPFNETQMTMRSTIIVKAVYGFRDGQDNEIYQPTAALLAAGLIQRCLRSDQARRIFEGKRVLLEMVQKAKDEGLTIKVRHAKILFCGAPRVGKTSFSRLLRNKEHKEVGSTDAGHAKQVLISGKVNVIDKEWINLDRKLETHRLTEILSLKVHEQEQIKNKNESQTKDDANEEPFFPTDVDTSNVQLPAESNDQIITENVNLTILQPKNMPKENMPQDNKPKDNKPTTIIPASNTTENKSIEEEVTNISFLKLKESIPDTWDLFTLLDTGGQPEFINMLPAINASTDITFIVMDISEGRECLNTNIKAIYENKKYTKYGEQILKYTNRDLLNCLLSLIKVSSKKEDQFHPELIKEVVPENNKKKQNQKVVYIIGTFADELKTKLKLKYDEEVGKIDEEIKKMVELIAEKDVIGFHCNEAGKYLKPIDNKVPRDLQNNDPTVEAVQSKTIETVLGIRIHCNDILHEKAQYEIPITWFLLELQLRKSTSICIPMSEVESICNEKIPSLKDDQIKEVLKFYHLYGMLLYFDEVDGMNNYVITDPQWLFTNLTKIVMCQFKEDVKDIYGKCYQEMCNGICDMELLNKFELDLHGIELESFVKLLEHFKFIAPMEDNSTSMEDNSYFIPSMLPSCVNIENMFTEDEFGSLDVLTHDGHCIEVEPLLIEHTFGTIPRGLFGFLIVQLLQDNETASKKYTPHGENDRSKNLFYRCADLLIFFVKPCFYVCICDRISYLEIKIRAKGNKSSYHYKAQSAITEALKKVCDRFDWSFKDCHYGFLCRYDTGSCAESQHLTLLPADDTSPPEDAYCKHNQWTELNVAHQIWFTDVQATHYYKKNDDNTKVKRKCKESSDTESNNDFDCKAAAQYLRKHIVELSKLPYKAMGIILYSESVITYDEKELITSITTNKDKMEYLIIKVLIVSLNNLYPDKFMGFLATMETSDDKLLQKKARDIKRDLKIR